VSGPALIVYGAGGFGREVAWLAECATPPWTVVSFADDAGDDSGRLINDVPTYTLPECARRSRGAACVIGVGDPSNRERMAGRAAAAGLLAATLVHRNVQYSRYVTLGAGTLLCAGAILTVNIVPRLHHRP
jgi:hypothetical protein